MGLSKRLRGLAARAPRFRSLAAVGVNTRRLLRTGGIAALTYGQAVTGVAPATLLRQRRLAAALAAPATGTNGQDLDLALILADGSEKGRADPAFDAHLMPIGKWAEGGWGEWLPRRAMTATVAKLSAKLTQVRSIWQHVRGPAAAMIASAWRLGWHIVSATELVTDAGRTLHLDLDPPAVVKAECVAAVKRWRYLAVCRKFPHLGLPEDSHGLMLKPLWRLLDPKGKWPAGWSANQAGGLTSAVANRQWCQDRGWVAGWANHDRCMLCVHANMARRLANDARCEPCEPDTPMVPARPRQCKELEEQLSEQLPPPPLLRNGDGRSTSATLTVPPRPTEGMDSDEQLRRRLPPPPPSPMPHAPPAPRDAPGGDGSGADLPPVRPPHSSAHAHEAVEHGNEPPGDFADQPTAEDIDSAPVGTLQHRVCDCPQLSADRSQWGPDLLNDLLQRGEAVPQLMRAALSSGLYPVPRLNLQPHLVPPPDGTFRWVYRRGELQTLSGRIYTDASRINDSHPDVVRLGWAVVAVDDDHVVTAIASGTPPDYITDIPAAEAWALFQATTFAELGSVILSDCKPCVDGIHSGRKVACAANRPLARVMNLIFDNKGLLPDAAFVWMPSHTSAAAVGRTFLGNGQALTAHDRDTNAIADTEAKLAAAAYAVDPEVLGELDAYALAVRQAYEWLGHVTYLANHRPPPARRDSEASRVAANLGRSLHVSTPRLRPPRGGARAARTQSEAQAASAARAQQWASRAASSTTATAATLRGNEDQGAGILLRKHQRMRSGTITWCRVCGAYAEKHGVGLAKHCPGPVADDGWSGGRAQQLRALLKCRHPKLGHRLPAPLPERLWVQQAQLERQAAAEGSGRLVGDEAALQSSLMGRRQLRLRAKLARRREGRPEPLVTTAAEAGDDPSDRGLAAQAQANKLIAAIRGSPPTKRRRSGPRAGGWGTAKPSESAGLPAYRPPVASSGQTGGNEEASHGTPWRDAFRVHRAGMRGGTTVRGDGGGKTAAAAAAARLAATFGKRRGIVVQAAPRIAAAAVRDREPPVRRTGSAAPKSTTKRRKLSVAAGGERGGTSSPMEQQPACFPGPLAASRSAARVRPSSPAARDAGGESPRPAGRQPAGPSLAAGSFALRSPGASLRRCRSGACACR